MISHEVLHYLGLICPRTSFFSGEVLFSLADSMTLELGGHHCDSQTKTFLASLLNKRQAHGYYRTTSKQAWPWMQYMNSDESEIKKEEDQTCRWLMFKISGLWFYALFSIILFIFYISPKISITLSLTQLCASQEFSTTTKQFRFVWCDEDLCLNIEYGK